MKQNGCRNDPVKLCSPISSFLINPKAVLFTFLPREFGRQFGGKFKSDALARLASPSTTDGWVTSMSSSLTMSSFNISFEPPSSTYEGKNGRYPPYHPASQSSSMLSSIPSVRWWVSAVKPSRYP
uniref:Uncharacterized protein n=1 Tax=Coccidioides posadasii RMSCC 3488 TaxID=454284 RepID=A0A0J6F3H3_COCPO|nr:hypothetical protein CPAG_01010 [Coccidioides posadasii RMSCC 3488]